MRLLWQVQGRDSAAPGCREQAGCSRHRVAVRQVDLQLGKAPDDVLFKRKLGGAVRNTKVSIFLQSILTVS